MARCPRMSQLRPIRLLILVVAGAGLAGCTGGDERGVVRGSMSISPQTALLDRPVAVSVRGLPAGARTTVTAKATDSQGTTWSASADFEATAGGVVSLDQAPDGGSYSGANPMGLFEFLAPPSGSSATTFLSPASGYDVTLQATVEGQIAATGTVHRQSPAAVGVVQRSLRPPGDAIYGTLYLPDDTSVRRPAVLVVGGSEGGLGLPAFSASLLAANGYPSLALAYFDAPGLPPELANIPLEYFAKALAVLRAEPGVDPRHVLVSGVSRGSEAALLLGVHFPRLVNGVIAGVPSAVVYNGFPDASKPAWTLNGRGLPGVGRDRFGAPAAAVDPRSVIPVERIRGPILLACGGQDALWPSCPYTDDITQRLSSRHFAFPVTALRYPEAGHLVGNLTAYYSLTSAALTGCGGPCGGTLPGTQAGLADGHTKLLAFLASL